MNENDIVEGVVVETADAVTTFSPNQKYAVVAAVTVTAVAVAALAYRKVKRAVVDTSTETDEIAANELPL